jgi:tetratricopeptide (TPR) repeat protein
MSVVVAAACVGLASPTSADVAAWERLSNAGLKASLEGRLEDAEVALKAALEESEKDDVGTRIVLSLENLGDFYRRVDRLAEAETMHLRALHVAESMRGPNDVAVENPLKSLAWLYHRTGRYGEAYAYYERVLTIVGHDAGFDSPAVAAYLVVMAELERLQGAAEHAVTHAQRALDIAEHTLGQTDPNIGTILSELVWDLRILGRDALATEHSLRLRRVWASSGSRGLTLCRDALGFRQDVLGARHPGVAKALADVALVLDAQGRGKEAEPLYRRAITILDDAGAAGSPSLVPLLTDYAGMLRSVNRVNDARLVEARIAALRAVSPTMSRPR